VAQAVRRGEWAVSASLFLADVDSRDPDGAAARSHHPSCARESSLATDSAKRRAISPAKLGPGRRSLVHGELLVQGEVLQGELAEAADQEGQDTEQVEQECDHRAGILSGSEPTDQPLGRRTEFWRRAGVRETRSRRLTWRGLETDSRRTYTGTKLETADTAKGSLRGTAPVLDPTTFRLPDQRPAGAQALR
jgi:hypothetical protein